MCVVLRSVFRPPRGKPGCSNCSDCARSGERLQLARDHPLVSRLCTSALRDGPPFEEIPRAAPPTEKVCSSPNPFYERHLGAIRNLVMIPHQSWVSTAEKSPSERRKAGTAGEIPGAGGQFKAKGPTVTLATVGPLIPSDSNVAGYSYAIRSRHR